MYKTKKNNGEDTLSKEFDNKLDHSFRPIYEHDLNPNMYELYKKLDQTNIRHEEKISALKLLKDFQEFDPTSYAFNILHRFVDDISNKEYSSLECMTGFELSKLVCKLSSLEKLKSESPHNLNNVIWIYDLIESWSNSSIEYISDINDSLDSLLGISFAPSEAKKFVELVNDKLITSNCTHRFERIGVLANNIVNIPDGTTKKLYMLLIRGTNLINKQNARNNNVDCLNKLINVCTALNGFFKKYSSDDFNVVFDELKFDPYESNNDLIYKKMDRLKNELTNITSGKVNKILNSDKKAQSRLKKITQEHSAILMFNNHQLIKEKLGQEIAEKFKSTVDYVKLLEDSKPEILTGISTQFRTSYAHVLLGTATKEEQNNVGAILKELSKFVSKNKLLTDERKYLMDNGSKEFTPKEIKRISKDFNHFDIPLSGDYWDLRTLQLHLYQERAAIYFLTFINSRLNFNLYDNLAKKLHDENYLEPNSKISIVGGGCGDAKKEIRLYKNLKDLNYNVDLVLIDQSDFMLNKAVLECDHKNVPLPPLLNINLEKLNWTDLSQYINSSQIIFCMFGGTVLNFPNKWGFYSQLNDLLEERVNELYWPIASRFKLVNQLTKLVQSSKSSRSQDIVITEGDLWKDLDIYNQPDSKNFLRWGVDKGHKIDLNSLTYNVETDKKSELTRVVIDNPKNKTIEFAYLVTKNYEQFKRGDVVFVIDSGKIVKNEFEWMLSGCGFSCNWLDSIDLKDSATIAISKKTRKNKVAEKQVQHAINTYKRNFM
ncbi:hypothetical protein HOK51_10710 [Candidatus Woesearchaeota archaeon]|jgi:hypothetical protein|nr:hypothetical protein [Candidatus Woesearchaeota archaeon]MBT6520292.1 hypothetical protein [Candidatus Woesearchaeota archaeon]MBT7368244.1 hypothetical protein [Candidatus Woesearchaeota archaeon]